MKIVTARIDHGRCYHGIAYTEHDGCGMTSDSGMSMRSAITWDVFHSIVPGESYMIEKNGKMSGPFTKPGGEPPAPEPVAEIVEDEPAEEPPEETGPVTVPPFCHYEVWNRETGALELCGADATETGPDLCAEHAAFVKDSTEGAFTKSKKEHPAGYDWLKKAKAAFGIKPFTMGKPSDAGKKPAPFDPAEIAEWNARAVHYSTDPDIGPYCVLPAFWKGPGPTPTIEIVNVDTPELEHIEPLPGDVYCVQISDAQIAFIRALIVKKPEKYAPLLV